MSDRPEMDGPRALRDYVHAFGDDYAAAMRTAETAPRRSRTRRRIGAGAVALAAAAAAGVFLLPGGRVDTVQAASAALGGAGEILHLRTVSTSDVQGHVTDATCQAPLEVWQATGGRPRYRERVPAPPVGCAEDHVYLSDGTAVTGDQEFAIDGTTSSYYLPDQHRLDVTTGVTGGPAFGLPGMPGGSKDPVADVRAALGSGALRVTGRARSAGRELVALTGRTRTTIRGGKPPSGSIVEHDLRYVIDARTYAPVRLSTTDTTYYFKGNGRPRDGSFRSSYTTTFLTYERLPMTRETEGLLTIRPTTRVTRTVTSAARLAAENDARMRRENAEGRRNAARAHAAQRREHRTGNGR